MKRALLLLAGLLLTGQSVMSQSNAIVWHGIFGGAGTGQAGGWIVSGTIGQPVATVASGSVIAGFWTQAFSSNNASNGAVSLGVNSLTEPPSAGSDSVFLITSNPAVSWTGSTGSAWLHLSAGAQSGTGSVNLVFQFDANPGGTRVGSITWAGNNLTVTQAGSSYLPANPLTALITAGLNTPRSVAVDPAGNVYLADLNNNAIKKWSVSSNAVTTLVSTGIGTPFGVAVDRSGNVYFSDQSNKAIKEWVAASGTVNALVTSGLTSPKGVAVDLNGNVYFADSSANTIKEWMATNGAVVTLVSTGLNAPRGISLDRAGDVYIADTGNAAIKVWSTVSQTVSNAISSGLTTPYGVAVDGGGNLYIADGGANAIKKWSAASNSLSLLIGSGLSSPYGVAVDAAGNVYVGDSGNNAIRELPRAFVAPFVVTEPYQAGMDGLSAVLPVSENLSGPFAPSVSSSGTGWLTLTGVSGGVVMFNFSANTNSNPRSAFITVLGQSSNVVSQAGQSTLGAQVVPSASSQGFGVASINLSAANAVSLSFSGTPGMPCLLQRSYDLVTWQVISMTNIPPGGFFNFTDQFRDLNGQAPGAAFYRLVKNSP